MTKIHKTLDLNETGIEAEIHDDELLLRIPAKQMTDKQRRLLGEFVEHCDVRQPDDLFERLMAVAEEYTIIELFTRSLK